MFAKRRDHISKAIAASSVHGNSVTDALIRSEFWGAGDTTALAYLKDALDDATLVVDAIKFAIRVEEGAAKLKDSRDEVSSSEPKGRYIGLVHSDHDHGQD